MIILDNKEYVKACMLIRKFYLDLLLDPRQEIHKVAFLREKAFVLK